MFELIQKAAERLERFEKLGPAANSAINLLHVHIPKTAGMSFLALFKKRFPVHAHLPWDSPAAVWREFLQGVRPPRFTTGHITFAEALAPAEAAAAQIQMISVIRDPVDRALSQFNYGRSEEYPGHVAFSEAFPTADAFFCDAVERRNIQTNWLCGKRDDAETLKDALDYHYCGLAPLEHIEGYTDALQRAFCEGEIEPLPRINELTKIVKGEKATRLDISPYLLRRFKDAQALDYRLYDELLEHWAKIEAPLCLPEARRV